MNEAILNGSLKAISVPDLLTFINMTRMTGALWLRSEDKVRKVFWEKGDMIFASSSDPEESLGSFLVRHGKITQEQNMKAGLHVEPGKRQGKVLVQMGALTPKELWWAVKNQALEIIYSCFRLIDGSFSFEETDKPNDEKITLSTTTTNIVMEGIRRLDEWPRIRELIPNDHLVLLPAPPETRDKSVNFLEGERAVFALVDGTRDIREIIYNSKQEEFETLRILMSLIMAKYVMFPHVTLDHLPEDVEDASILEEMALSYNRIFSKILKSLSGNLDGEALEDIASKAVKTVSGEILEGVRFDESGRLDPKVLTANVADLHVEKRASALDVALSSLLSFLLFEAGKHLGPEEKSAIYRMAGERFSIPTTP